MTHNNSVDWLYGIVINTDSTIQLTHELQKELISNRNKTQNKDNTLQFKS